MRRPYLRGVRISGIVLLILSVTMLMGRQAWAETPTGMVLELYRDQGASQQYEPGRPIKLIMVLRNVTGGPLNTNRDFSNTELHRYLTITLPDGQKINLAEAGLTSDPPPPIFSDGKALRTAEILSADYVQSVVIDDLTELVPQLQDITGRITIEASLPFASYRWTVFDTNMGLMGVQDDSAQGGEVDATPMQIEISPLDGTHLQVTVSKGQAPVFQAEAKLFNALIAETDFADAFNGSLIIPPSTVPVQPIAHIYTGTDGIAAFLPESCLPRPAPGEGYTAIVRNGQDIKGVTFAEGENGWDAGCDGIFSKEVVFETALTPIQDLYARAKSGKINLVWTCPTDAVTYNIYRSTTQGGPYSLIQEGHVTTYCAFADLGLANNITYYYVVRWVNAAGIVSPESNEANATPTARTRRR